MSLNEINDKTRLVELADAIRRKYNKFRHGEADHKLQMERKYKPLVELQKSTQLDRKYNVSGINAEEEGVEPNAVAGDFITCQDTIFGIKRNNDGSYSLGDYPVQFLNNKIQVADAEYDLTNGLISLLTQKIPKNFSSQDVQSYKQMLIDTSAHLRKSDNQIKSNRGPKTNFVKDLFKPSVDESPKVSSFNHNSPGPSQLQNVLNTQKKLYEKLLSSSSLSEVRDLRAQLTSPLLSEKYSSAVSTPTSSLKPRNLESGDGLQMKLIKKGDHVKSLYSYWDDPNELVDRLYLLHASKQAGNNSVVNEIISIESELRQAGYIY